MQNAVPVLEVCIHLGIAFYVLQRARLQIFLRSTAKLHSENLKSGCPKCLQIHRRVQIASPGKAPADFSLLSLSHCVIKNGILSFAPLTSTGCTWCIEGWGKGSGCEEKFVWNLHATICPQVFLWPVGPLFISELGRALFKITWNWLAVPINGCWPFNHSRWGASFTACLKPGKWTREGPPIVSGLSKGWSWSSGTALAGTLSNWMRIWEEVKHCKTLQ